MNLLLINITFIMFMGSNNPQKRLLITLYQTIKICYDFDHFLKSGNNIKSMLIVCIHYLCDYQNKLKERLLG